MKALFIIFHGFEAYNGISKKIHYQVDAMKSCGLDTQLCYINIDELGYQKRMVDDEVLESFEYGFKGKVKKWIDYSSVLNYIETNKIDIVYIRSYHNANPFLVSAVKHLKKRNVKVLLEIPTYPYDDEYTDSPFLNRLQLYIDKMFRHSLSKQLFRVVTFSNDKLIFGAPTIRISNGIDFKAIPLKSDSNNNPTEINLLGLAEIHFWHGFDRVIAGLGEYYSNWQPGQIKVTFNIAGYGESKIINNLEQMAANYNISEYVNYLGPKYGKELDECFESADIGIASLGRHRSGIVKIKTLKNREYAARGIPFIYSEIDDDFENMPYILKEPTDDSPIDINSLIDFFKNQNLHPSQIRESIKHLSWENQMQIIVNECTKKPYG